MPHGKKHGLYENIRLKKQRIAKGSGERMRKKGAKAHLRANFKEQLLPKEKEK